MSKTILITGSTDGIGKLTAEKLAKAGHEVYVHGRNQEKLDSVVKEIRERTNNDKVNGFVGDLSDLKEVKQLAKRINDELPKLDILINNAGVYHSQKPLNAEGLDIRFVVNYLAPYLLSKKLLPVLEKGSEVRIINLSSAAQSPVNLQALAGKETISVSEAYAQSKLALTMWSFDLAKKLKNISVIPVNPGSLLNTKMVKEAFGNHWSPVDKGADILFDLAVSEDHKNDSGKYFDNDRGSFGSAHPDAYDQKKIDELIELTVNILSKS